MLINEKWAEEQLEKYLELHTMVPVPPGESKPRGTKNRMQGSPEERYEQGLVVKHIWEAMWGEYPRRVDVDMARRCLFEIRRGGEMAENLAVTDGPSLIAEDLHPWVWTAAASHWASDNHGAAVWAAGVNVNSRLQRKLDRFNLGGVKLIRESFSTDAPEQGRPRLRLCDDSNPDLFRDMHLGAMHFGTGLYAAVRNPLNHVAPDEHALSPQEALECLAAFSLFARWVQRADVVLCENE